MHELNAHLKTMASGKAKDGACLVVEMLKAAGEGLLSTIAEVFNDVMQFDVDELGYWEESRVVVLFQEGRPAAARQLQTDIAVANNVQVIQQSASQQTERSSTSLAKRGPGRIQIGLFV